MQDGSSYHMGQCFGVTEGVATVTLGKSHNSQGNQVLASLDDTDFALIERHLEPVLLKARQSVETASRPITRVYFPHRGIISIIAVTRHRRHQSEVGLVGREGMTGLTLVTGTEPPSADALVQIEVDAVSIGAEQLRAALRSSSSLRLSLLRYVHVFAVQSAHTALANARGNIEQRLARWLLMAQDRMPGSHLQLTHEFLSIMLGVRRAGVTIALQQLESEGLVATARGSVAILDRRGLELRCDGLYGFPERELERLFG
jgi:CRP-like cAMP-binding protein